MNSNIALDIFKLKGPIFNQLESLKIKGLTRNHFSNYNRAKRKLCNEGIILTQIFGDILFFRIDVELSISQFIKNIEEILNGTYLSHSRIEDLEVKHCLCVFPDNFYHKNQVIPNILKETFLCTLSREISFDGEIDYRENIVYIPHLDNKIVGFKFQFSIDENFEVYMFLDLIYDIEFSSSIDGSFLPKSSKRIQDYVFFKKIANKFSFSCAGKKYHLNPEIVIFKKVIEEREC